MEKPWLWIGVPVVIAAVSLLMLGLAENSPKGSKSGVQITDIKEGNGREAKAGDTVSLHYVGKFKDGRKFDSSLDHPGGEPITFKLGAPGMIKGFGDGIIGMKVGGVRTIVIPPALAYGKEGKPPHIPPDTELHFELELLQIR